MIINDYKLVEKIGRGSYGEVWKGINIQKSNNVAIKISKKSIKNILKMEIIILRHLKHLKVVPSVKYFGQTLNFDYIIMELLGDNIDVYYFGITEQTLGEIKWIGLKMLNCLKEIHNNGIIHRDIKPDNFLLGLNNERKRIYIIDFGLCKSYMNNDEHNPIKKINNLIGSLTYASINTHNCIELSRRDDMESLGYMLVFFYLGTLPWQELTSENIDIIQKLKQDITSNDKIPQILVNYIKYVRSLEYEEKPNYFLIIDNFKRELEILKKN